MAILQSNKGKVFQWPRCCGSIRATRKKNPPMSELVKVCPTAEVADNSVKSFEVGNNVIAVYNLGGTFYATDNECTHAAPFRHRRGFRAARLAEGILEDDIIECTLHFGAFNVKTGAAVQAPCFTPLRTYKVVVQDGQVMVDLDKTAED